MLHEFSAECKYLNFSTFSTPSHIHYFKVIDLFAEIFLVDKNFEDDLDETVVLKFFNEFI